MRNYRSDSESSEGQGNVASASKAQPSESYMDYIAAYENDLAEEEVSFTEQTIDEEYNAYVSSAPIQKRANLDPLKFWEVSSTIIIILSTTC